MNLNSSISESLLVEVAGELRPAQDSSGRLISKDEKGQRAFWEWYGDGPVDTLGRPIVLYHGTQAEIDSFDPRMQGINDSGYAGAGFYFTDDPDVASAYAGFSVADEGANVVPAYMALQNPKLVSSYAEMYPDEKLPGTREEALKVQASLIEQGYDGVIFRGKSMNQFVAFYPEQIKSAIGNPGVFSKSSPHLTDHREVVIGFVIDFEAVRPADRKSRKKFGP